MGLCQKAAPEILAIWRAYDFLELFTSSSAKRTLVMIMIKNPKRLLAPEFMIVKKEHK